MNSNYEEFIDRLRLLYEHSPDIFLNTFQNIFSCREIGNKTHGDLAEIAMDEFINQFMYDYSSLHTGKENYRKKTVEEDISVTKKTTRERFNISLKCYGKGPLQLSTDKGNTLFPFLEENFQNVPTVKESAVLKNLLDISTLSLIYDEENKKFNILSFDKQKFAKELSNIEFVEKGGGRKHPVYKFINYNNEYMAECRYGGQAANALQRGLWTHTDKASNYFKSITNGWKKYQTNSFIKKLFSKALLSTQQSHQSGISLFQADINDQKNSIQ